LDHSKLIWWNFDRAGFLGLGEFPGRILSRVLSCENRLEARFLGRGWQMGFGDLAFVCLFDWETLSHFR
jgi:hypothetical protein